MDAVQVKQEIRAAIKQGDAERVRALLGSDKTLLTAMTPFGTWLHVAAAHGKLDVVKLLVSLGADVNCKGGILGGGPLNEAASKGHLSVVQYLLSSGAELDVSEPQFNPLFSAIYGGHFEVARQLVQSGIDTQIKYNGENMNDMDALAFALEWDRSDIAALLSSSGPDEG